MSERKRKKHKDLVWYEDKDMYYVCAWCEKKAETEQHVRFVEIALQLLAATRGVQRTEKRISHSICEKHKQKMLQDHAKGVHRL